MNNDTTSIMDLPTDPTGGGGGSNIKISASEVPGPNQGQPAFNLDQNTINQIVNGLQQASSTGATQLPSRDIPMITSNINADPQVQVNYIPQQATREDYIKGYEEGPDMVSDYNRKASRNESLDDLYSEIQTPILLAVMYFLFQLPVFRRQLFRYFPVLFSTDGNFNINGYIFSSILFGLMFYLMNKTTTHFGQF
jgi:hypothetical protein